MKLKRVVALLMALCIILTSMPIGALASEEIADGTYAVAEELTNTHEYVDGVCIICGELHPSYIPLDSVEWVANQVIDGQLYRIRLNFKDGHWTYALGKNIDQYDADFRETILREYAQDIVLVDGTYYFLEVGDGGDFTYTTNEKNVYVNCEEYMHFTLGRTTEEQLTVVESDSSAIREGVVLVYCGEHDWQSATCISPKMCTVCGEIEGEANGHSWDEGKETTGPTGEQAGVKTYTCTICGEIWRDLDGRCGSNLTWALDKAGTLTISGTGKMNDWDYNTNAPWYDYYASIKTVVVEDGVSTIGDIAFYGCNNLVDIDLPDSVTSIGDSAFRGCSSLASIDLPESLTSINWSVFKDCSSLTSIDLPDGVTSIGDNAFYSCSSLTSIDLPDSVTSIDESAFYNCSSLKEITFAGNAPSISSDAFYNVTATVYYPAGNSTWTDDYKQNYRGTLSWVEKWMERGGKCGENLTWTLDEDGLLTISGTGKMKNWNSYSQVPWYGYRGMIKAVVLEDGVESICKYAFYNCTSLISIDLSDSVTSIGERSFDSCSSLVSINIPEGITSIGYATFSGCSNLESVYLPDSLTKISYSAFAGCSSLASIDLPNGITSVGESAFIDCSALTSITIPVGLTFIDQALFANCTSLKEITFSSSAPFISSLAFQNVTATVYYPAGNTTWTDDNKQNYGGALTWIEKRMDPSGKCGENLIWKLDAAGTLTISGTGKMYKWTSKSPPPWYSYREKIKTVVVEDGVAAIRAFAFARCTQLTSVTLPDSVTAIGNRAFYECSSLVSIELPDSVKSIDERAFTYCRNLTSIDLPDGLTSIGDNAFYSCSSLTCINMPDNVRTIGSNAFLSCSNLVSVDLSDNLTSIGYQTFSNCRNLTRIDIPDSVTSIDDYAFAYCSNLISIDLGNSATCIGYRAFSDCSSLTEITFSGNAPSILSYAFDYVTATVYYPAGNSTWTSSVKKNYGGSLTWIEKWMDPSGKCGENLTWTLDEDGLLTISGTGKMYKWTSASPPPWYSYREKIKTVVVEDGVAAIRAFAFAGCTQLTSVTLPDSVTAIGNRAFYECSSLVSIELPDSVKSIAERAFASCSSLVSIEIPDNVRSIGDYAFFNCSNLASINIPVGITSIRYATFSGCSSLVSVNLPDSLTKISYSAFAGCSSLASIDLPNGIISIGESAFIDCSALTSITIPDGLTFIDQALFANCTSLEEITFSGNAPSISSNAFYNVTATVYYPAGNTTWTDYYKQNYGGTLTWIEKWMDSSGKCGENLIWTLDEDGLLTISGTGKMDDWDSSTKVSWHGYREMIKTVVLEEGISSIGNYAFYECSSLTSINLPDSLTFIGEWAFSNCSSLASIDIPKGITSIRYGAFSGCSGLVSVDLPDSLRKISYSAFAGCSSLASIDLPDGITSIGGGAFTDCSSLTSITLPGGLTYVDYALFTNCNSLTSIYLPAGITAISERAFFGCSSVTNINFAGDAPRIGYEAFYNVTANAYYPAGNDTWTHAAKQNYGGNLTWIAACPDHQYADPAYIWSDDFVSCTATRSCINPQCEEVKREKVRASIETRAATCEEEGKTVYIVMFTSDVFTTQTKERSIPALGHDCSYTVTAEPDLANTGLITGICSRCSHQREVELPCLNVEDYAYEVTLEPTLTQLGAGVYTWKETAYGTFRFTVTLDKLAPELEELTVATNPDKTVYRLGEPLDTTGLVLQAVYSDGSIRTVTSGYRVSELDSSSPGEKTITVNYEGRSTTFQVTVQPMAETDPQIIVSNTKGVLGHKVNVTISLKNNPGVTSMMLTVGYDPAVLQLQSVTDAGSLSNACHSDNYGSNPYTLTWDNDLARNDFVFDGELVTLTFLVAEDAEVGESAVTVSYAYDNYEIFNAAGENVWFATVNGSVNVIDVLLGDVNSDGKVNAYDRAYLARYFAKWTEYPESVINMDAADVNRDGMVNAHDRVYLARHLAKWTGYETLG